MISQPTLNVLALCIFRVHFVFHCVLSVYFILFVHVSLTVLCFIAFYIYCGQLLVHLCALLSSETYVKLFYPLFYDKLSDDDGDGILKWGTSSLWTVKFGDREVGYDRYDTILTKLDISICDGATADQNWLQIYLH